MTEKNVTTEIEDLHKLACEKSEKFYIDPTTGYKVMTSFALLKNKKCCGNGCRHCPYNHINVKKKDDTALAGLGVTSVKPNNKSTE